MTIRRVTARRIWDSRGRPTVEVEVETADGASGRGVAPAGASRGSREAVERRDGGTRLGGLGVREALQGIEREIAPLLVGRQVADQAGIDAALVALDGTPPVAPGRQRPDRDVAGRAACSRGASAPAAVALPGWRPAGAAALPQIQIFGGGAHAGRRVDVQDFMVIATGARSSPRRWR
jgi:enolase